MTEITTYKCDFCGQEFDDEQEYIHHEWKCRYEDLCKNGNCKSLKLFKINGEEIDGFDYPDCDEIGAIKVYSYAQALFINDYFEEQGCGSPIRIVDGFVERYGLWYFDPEYLYGDWRSYEKALKNIQNIGAKFNQRA